MIEEDLMSLMLGDLGVNAVVGERIHWRERPQGDALPDIIMHNLGGPVDYHMQGASGLRQVRIQFDCWSRTSKAEALSVRRAVESLLSGLISSQANVEIQGAFIDSYNDDVAQFGEALEKYYRERIDFLFFTGAIGAT